MHPPGSPANIRRTFSRRSVYSLQSDASTSEFVENGRFYNEGNGESGQTKERRKLFSRPSRSSVEASAHSQHDRLGGSNASAGGPGFLRRVSSRSLLGRGKEANEDPMASSDSLASTSTSRGLSKRASDVLSRGTSFGHWSRKGKGTFSVGEDGRSDDGVLEQGHRSSIASSPEAKDAKDLYLAVPGEAAVDVSQGEGIPKRLSGWLLNMLSSENVSSDSQTRGMTMSDSITTIKHKTSATDLQQRSEAPPMAPSTSASSQVTNGRSAQTTVTPRSRTAGLLSTLAASGRSRADANTSNPGAHAARSGLDRALRYFMDNSDDADTDEGIWLLGVWHGPMEERSTATGTKLGPAIEVSSATPVREISPHAIEGASSKRGSDVGHDDSSSLASSAQRTRETSPSIASASSKGSVGRRRGATMERSGTPSGDEAPIVARNPPTPQTSPILTNSKAAGERRKTDADVENGVNLVAAIAIAAEKTNTFQADFSSRIWCTYRSHFTPIARDGTISEHAERAAAEAAASAAEAVVPSSAVGDAEDLSTTSSTAKGGSRTSTEQLSSSPIRVSNAASPSPGALGAAFGISASTSSAPVSPSGGGGLSEKMGIPSLWNRAAAAAQAYGLAGRSGLTTDAGWGCMLRTGQSVLANALLNVHLGRDWRRIAKPLPSQSAPIERDAPEAHRQWCKRREQYSKYVRLLSWFMDEPSRACPFGVHRMAREGKRLGKEVGEWFGPSTAAGAIKKLVDEFPECEIGVNVASDGVIYLDQVKAQAQRLSEGHKRSNNRWTRPVLVLIGIRLGLEGVHPMYHDSVKATFSFPQSVGIAGGRPSSSYYFVGYQGNSLFYLDPHHVRSGIPFRHPPSHLTDRQEWWAQAYSEQELATYHNDRPRRMPMKSLDPSMLLGFLIQDEEALDDFVARVRALPRPIFSVLESMPKWMMEDAGDTEADEDKAIESISESSIDGGDQSRTEECEESLVDVEDPDFTDEEHEEVEQGDHGASSVDRRRKRLDDKLTQSVTSTSTATPRLESTFEFVDRQARSPPQQSPPVARPIAFPSLGSFDDVEKLPSEPQSSSLNGADGRDTVARYETLPAQENLPYRAYSSTSGGSDIGSAWEDVQADVLPSPKPDRPVKHERSSEMIRIDQGRDDDRHAKQDEQGGEARTQQSEPTTRSAIPEATQ